MEDEYTKQLRIAEQAIVSAIRSRPRDFAPILVTILQQLRELLNHVAP